MPPMGPQKPPLPKHWRKQHLDIYKDMQSVKHAGEILRTLLKYSKFKADKTTDLPQELIDAHIEVARHILEKEKGYNKNQLDNYLNRQLNKKP